MKFFYIYLWFPMLVFANSSVVLIADPRVTKIPICENHEPLINLKQQKLLCYGPSPEIPNNRDYVYLRKTVYQKLVAAEQQLPPHIHLCIYEGYRSLRLQKKLFIHEYHKIQQQHPQWLKVKVFQATMRLVAPVINLDGSKNVPPHATGGAIDIYLVDQHRQPLDMGIHPKDWMQDLNDQLSLTQSHKISKKAQKNRALMSRVLRQQGLVNYPTEYWHWSYGDRYWAYLNKKKCAIYGEF